jgi:hypothetical protein
MKEVRRLQGRLIGATDIDPIRCLIEQHPDWHRTRLSRHLGEVWAWRDAAGRIKDMACRTLLLKLQRQGLVRLPDPVQPNGNPARGRNLQPALHRTPPREGSLDSLRPIRWTTVEQGAPATLGETLVRLYHYLGFRTRVGHSLRYLALDRQDRPMGCLLLGAAAGTCAPRDRFIGWTSAQRQAHLPHVLNNMRFLIPPWVRIPHWARHLLALAVRQLPTDWQRKSGFPIPLLETFVDKSRFSGTGYRAAPWLPIGDTTGRSRQDRDRLLRVPVKSVYVYPLQPPFRERLSQEDRCP